MSDNGQMNEERRSACWTKNLPQCRVVDRVKWGLDIDVGNMQWLTELTVHLLWSGPWQIPTAVVLDKQWAEVGACSVE